MKPVLQAMVLADHVYQDRQTGKHIIAGTFSHYWFGPVKQPQADGSDVAGLPKTMTGPITMVGSPYLYLALVDVKGQIQLVLKFIDLSDASVLFEANLVVACNDPLAVAEYIVPMPMLPLKGEGTYSLDLLHDGETLGSWRIQVKKIENQPTN